MKPFIHRQRVLFSDKYGWGDHICKVLNRWHYKPFFKSFDTVDLNEFDILVPQHLTDIAYIIDHHPEFNGKKCFIPPMLALETCNDKLLFNQFMITAGFGDMIPNITGTPAFPYILKKRIDEFGSRSRIIHHSKEESIFQKFIDSDDYYRQEYITGKDEFTTHILMVEGKIIFHTTLQFTFASSLFVKGVGCKAPRGKVIPFAHIKAFESILNQLQFEGLCCFNFKLVHGQVKVFEVNPRYGGSLTRFLPKVMKAYKKSLTPMK